MFLSSFVSSHSRRGNRDLSQAVFVSLHVALSLGFPAVSNGEMKKKYGWNSQVDLWSGSLLWSASREVGRNGVSVDLLKVLKLALMGVLHFFITLFIVVYLGVCCFSFSGNSHDGALETDGPKFWQLGAWGLAMLS